MAPVPPAYLAAPEDPAEPLLGRRPLADDLAAIVISDGRIADIVTVTRLRQILRQVMLAAQLRPARRLRPSTTSSGPEPGPKALTVRRVTALPGGWR